MRIATFVFAAVLGLNAAAVAPAQSETWADSQAREAYEYRQEMARRQNQPSANNYHEGQSNDDEGGSIWGLLGAAAVGLVICAAAGCFDDEEEGTQEQR